MNIGKNGLSSLGIGPRGASMSIGSKGKYANVGIPGTGLSFRHRLDGGVNTTGEQRLLRAQEKLEKAEQRQEALSKVSLTLNENGSIAVLSALNEPLSRADMKLMWDQQEGTILDWLENEAEEINGDVELLENIHYDTPDPKACIEYKAKEYLEPMPNKPTPSGKPTKEDLPALGFFSSFFKSRKEKHQQKTEELESRYQQNLQIWTVQKEKDDSQYLKEFENWEKEKAEYRDRERYNEENFSELVNTDIKFMENLLEDVFNSLEWPRETVVSYDIANNGDVIWIDIDLPEIEDLPQKVASIASTGRKLNIKNKAKRQLQLEYAKHIHGIAFRLVGSVFAALPKAIEIMISGYSQRLDTATGRINDEYLYSFKVDKEGFCRIDFNALELLDPIEALNVFEHKKKMTTTGTFKPIEPFEK